ncbi:hypothetical protein [Ideonella sp.]|jgi:hypothetical protein|uniref:hypothetical protein n=1 Tax=Ideonella sp. TaxID=1929293 RepID=UPI0037C0F998
MPTIKAFALFCAKCAAFTTIFWGVWLGVLRPIAAPPAQDNAASAQDAQAQMDAYERQLARVTQQLDVAEGQQKRTEMILSTQEEHAKRLDAVLTAWEKQTGLKK